MTLIPADLLKKTVFDAQIKNIKNKIHSINNSTTTTALNAVENKIPVKKADYDSKISDIEKNVLLHLIIMNLQMITRWKDNRKKVS